MIPDFLKRGHDLQKSHEHDKFYEAMESYENHFGDGVNTEPSTWTLEEWIDILNECVKTDTPLEVMFDLPVGEDVDY